MLTATPDEKTVRAIRENNGGQLAPQPVTQTRWYMDDLESAQHQADTGTITKAAQLMRAAIADGTLVGVASTRFGGVVRLPKRFRGDPELISELELGHESVRSTFDEMCPPQELALLARDGDFLGVAVGELVPVKGRSYPVLVRLDPAYLFFRWNEQRWYYNSIAGALPITPGDGRWVLHAPGGRLAPWQNGLWKALGRAYIRKEHANLHKDNWEGKLANPARVATCAQGASEGEQDSWFRAVMAWGVNTVFGMKPGYDVKLVESNGRGWECFTKTIASCDAEMIICVAGQTVTTDGGTGFANADIHKSIRADLIKATADALAYTVNTQILPQYAYARKGLEAIKTTPVVEWDVTPPRDRAVEGQALVSVASAITQLTTAFAPYQRTLDIDMLAARFGIPIAGDLNGDGKPEVTVKPPAAPAEDSQPQELN
jgi:hypothetical protein